MGRRIFVFFCIVFAVALFVGCSDMSKYEIAKTIKKTNNRLERDGFSLRVSAQMKTDEIKKVANHVENGQLWATAKETPCLFLPQQGVGKCILLLTPYIPKDDVSLRYPYIIAKEWVKVEEGFFLLLDYYASRQKEKASWGEIQELLEKNDASEKEVREFESLVNKHSPKPEW